MISISISISWPDQYPCALKVKSFNFHGYSTAGTYLHLSDQYYKVGGHHVIIIVMVMVMIIIFFSYHFTFVNFCANSQFVKQNHMFNRFALEGKKASARLVGYRLPTLTLLSSADPPLITRCTFCISKIMIFRILGRHPVWQWLRQRLHKVTQNIRKDQKDHDY